MPLVIKQRLFLDHNQFWQGATVLYVHSQKEGSLDLNFRASHKAIEPLPGMFATVILKLPALPPDPKDERVYDLNPLRQNG